MKDTARKKKKAMRRIETAYGKHEILEQKFHVITKGKPHRINKFL